MAKRRKKRKRKRKYLLRKGQCKKIRTTAGMRNLCKMQDGSVKFKKMSYKPR